MNLYDIVKRRDRCLRVETGAVVAVHGKVPTSYLGVSLAPGTRLLLRDAHEYAALRRFPRLPHWTVHVPAGGGDHISIRLRSRDGREHGLFAASTAAGTEVPVILDWPAWVGFVGGFDLLVENASEVPVIIATTWTFNPRLGLKPLIGGVGLEVGPGTNPFVTNDAGVQVSYIEAAPIDHWADNYGKSTDMEPFRKLWAQYRVDDAQILGSVPDGSVDFIFSSHVFEHLMNPIGVLENWRRKLKPGGYVLAVVPDLRFCFDLRQYPSGQSDWATEYRDREWQPSRAKYEAWCRYTTPETTPESLIERKYSIHCHYYTSETVLDLLDTVVGSGWYDGVFINAAPNNKDFGFALRASEAMPVEAPAIEPSPHSPGGRPVGPDVPATASPLAGVASA